MKKRVYLVAREQGLTSRELLDLLHAAGVEVTTASSNVNEALALEILARGEAAPAGDAPAPFAAPAEGAADPAETSALPQRAGSRRSVWLSFAATLVLVVVLSGAAGWALSNAFNNSSNPPASSSPGGPGSARAARPGDPPHVTFVAVARYPAVTVFRGPSAQRTMLTLHKPTATQPLTLLVKQTRGGWVQTYLPTRPNGVLGWLRASAVHLLKDPWALAIHLHSHHLVVRKAGRLVRTLPIAVGKSSTPTPTGHFFVNELLKQPDPAGAYGPYAFGTSDFSNVIKHFGNGGNGQIGIHGTDQPWVIGTSASHGCIRLYNADVTWLAKILPLGTPVHILS